MNVVLSKEVFMKKSILSLAVIAMLGLSACTSTKVSENSIVNEQQLASEFKRQGVRIIYDKSGNVSAIEVSAYAPIWGTSGNAAREAYRVAELEAKKSLNDFINKETIRSTTSVTMISRNLEKARDKRDSNTVINSKRDDVASMTDDLEVAANPADVNQEASTSSRDDALAIATKVSNTITTTNQGIISGLYLVEGGVIDGGKNVRVLYRWDTKSNKQRPVIRNMMMM